MKVKIKVCKHCGKDFMPSNFNQKCCKWECALAYTKTKPASDDGWKERKAELIESTKTLGDYAKELQTQVNKIVRLIDQGKPCISSGQIPNKPQAGHFYSVGSRPSLRYHLNNIHIQGFSDNVHKSGNPIGYRDGLLARYGQDYVNHLEGLITEYPTLKLSKAEIIEATKIARKIVLAMEKENKIYTGDDAIKKRASINEALGLYN